MEYYPRIIEEKLEKWIDKPEIVAIKGPRQAGKTTLMKHLKEKYGGEYISFEDEDLRRGFEKDPVMFIKSFGEEIIYLDEVQYVKNVGKKLKLVYDSLSNVKIFVTGSGSFEVKEFLGKFLVGRVVYFELLPLNFEEFLMWKDKKIHRIFLEYRREFNRFLSVGEWDREIIFYKKFLNLLEEYVVWGGYPRVVNEKDKEVKEHLLKNLAHTYIEKDIFYFLNIRALEKFKEFLKYLSLTSGSIFNASNISMSLHIDYKTIMNYLYILKSTYVIRDVSPFHKNMVTELRKPKKIYFYDLGLRNALIGAFNYLGDRQDIGQLLENFILNEFNNKDVRYWRTTGKAEVDFVLLLKDKVIPLEVRTFSYRVSRSYKSFCEAYKPTKGVIFTLTEKVKKETINGTKILVAPLFVV